MTRKDYILIAEALRISLNKTKSNKRETGCYDNLTPGERGDDGCYDEPQNTEAREAVIDAANELAYALRRDNPRFNSGHFLAVVNNQKELHSRPASRSLKEQEELVEALSVENKTAWRKACEYDRIDPTSKFVVFSDHNPLQSTVNETTRNLQSAIRKLRKMRRAS